MSYQWIWCGKATPLDKLHETQLNSINKLLLRHKGTIWFNVDSSDWRKAIKDELDRRKALNISIKTLNKLKNYKTCVHKVMQQK